MSKAKNQDFLHNTMIPMYVIFRSEMIRVFRIWPQSIIPSVVTSLLYYMIFGKVIGSKVGDVSGHCYISFIAPGLIIMSVINNAYSNIVSSVYGARFTGAIEEILVSSTSNIAFLFGYVGASTMRGIIVGILVGIVSCLFTDLAIYSLLFSLLLALLIGALVSFIGFINGMLANSFDDTTMVSTFILTPLVYLGGIFYSIELLATHWQIVAKINPILYIVNAFRFSMIGISDVDGNLAVVITILTCCVLMFCSLFVINRGIGIKK